MNTFLNGMIGESENLTKQLLAQAEELAQAIEADVTSRRMLKDAELALSQAESQTIVQAEMQAQDKAGPLAGVAKTSAAYKAICETLIADAHQNGLSALYEEVQQLRQASDDAQIARERHTVLFSALKYTVNHHTAILNALNN